MIKLKQNKAITLVALVITIIILLILVGITISQLSENGLFNKTQVAKEKYNIEEAKEQLEVEIANFKMQMYMNNNGKEVTLDDLKTYFDSEKFNGEYLVELFYEPLATTENVSVEPLYAKVTHIPTRFVFYVDGKLVVIGGSIEEDEGEPRVTLNKTNLNLYIGDNETLVGTVKPSNLGQEINWSTSDSSIVTVNENGKVTGVSSGTATITATSKEDENIKLTCTVVVTDKLDNIAITTEPTKKKYSLGDVLDLTGMVVTATYRSGETKVLNSSEYVSIPANGSQVQNSTNGVSVSYTEGNITEYSNFSIIVDCRPVSAEASNTYSGCDIAKSYDDSKETYWSAYPNGSSTAIYTFDTAYAFKNIEIYIGSVSDSTFNGTITIYGSNDKTEYTQIANSVTVNQCATTNFIITSTSEFKYIKVDISNGITGSNASWSGIHEINFILNDKNGVEEEFSSVGETIYTVPYTGTYKLEVWGAQGGSYSTTYHGGYGGYSVGEIYLTQGTKLYVNVGGAGSRSQRDVAMAGGYNGGGKARSMNGQYGIEYQGSGGGATHIALRNGELYELENYIDKILIVAGGGGGSGYYNYGGYYYYGTGGSGGGYIGGSETVSSHSNYPHQKNAAGGAQQYTENAGVNKYYTQSSWNTWSHGLFGRSPEQADPTNIEGGGGGFYGGGSSSFGAGAGGSGYIGNNNLTNKHMAGYGVTPTSGTDDESIRTTVATSASDIPQEDTAKLNNGYAKITLLSINE